MWPQIPENLSELTAPQLRELSRQIKDAAKEVLASGPTPDERAEVDTYLARRTEILAIAALADDDADDEPEADDEGDDDETEATATETEVVEPAATEATTPVVTTVGVTTVAAAAPVEPGTPRLVPQMLVATDAAPGMRGGETIESWRELGELLHTRANSLNPSSDTRHTIAQIPGRFADNRILSENPMFNLASFDEELTAAMCAPLEPIYDLACSVTARRPVAMSLPGFRAPRGGVTIYPSPTLEDITTGFGQWTHLDDADAQAVKEACQTIECATPEEYRIWGVYRCLTVKNLLQMTFPELVEAYLNRLAGAHARLAETLVLEAMATGADAVAAVTLGYNASTSITTTILNYLGLYQEQQRWDVDGLMEAWLPRWVVKAMQIDQARRRRTDGGFLLAPSEAQIVSQFRDAGVNPHFFIDRPSWATPIPPIATNGVLNFMPRNLEVLVAPPGKFALMDRGELNIGVTGNGLYRDNTSNSRNEFTFFFENFEGVVNTTSCPAHIISIDNLCYNGQQIADVVINCEGADQVGNAS